MRKTYTKSRKRERNMTGTDICILSNTSAFSINITQAIKSRNRL